MLIFRNILRLLTGVLHPALHASGCMDSTITLTTMRSTASKLLAHVKKINQALLTFEFSIDYMEHWIPTWDDEDNYEDLMSEKHLKLCLIYTTIYVNELAFMDCQPWWDLWRDELDA